MLFINLMKNDVTEHMLLSDIERNVLVAAVLYLLSSLESSILLNVFLVVILVSNYIKGYVLWSRTSVFKKGYKILYIGVSALILLSFFYGIFYRSQYEILNWVVACVWGGLLLVVFVVGLIYAAKIPKDNPEENARAIKKYALYADVLLFYVVFISTLNF